MALKPNSQPRSAAAVSSTETGPWIRLGNWLLAGLGIGLLAFSLISVSGAVVATGVVNVETNYKTVQHLDGGIVAKILVRNGDRVGEGDVLLRLDETQVKASHGVAVARMRDLLVQLARLEAERDRASAIKLPAEIAAAAADPALAKILTAQQALFDARMAAHRGEEEVLRQKIEQSQNEAAGTAKILEARKKEAAISASELAALTPLYERGFANQQRFMPVQREAARLEGEVGRLIAEQARVGSSLAEARLKLAQAEKEFTQQVVDELRKVQSQLAEVAEQRTALEDKLRRIEIRAPRAGRVHALAAHTEGGVITPGTPIMQVIPEGERLIIDAQITPQDIDKVRRGQHAQVRFPAFNAKTTPRLEASVAMVSAAQVTDSQQARSYFTAQITLAEGELARIGKGHELVPGMPAEVYIETGDRSILSYFVKPLLDALSRAFRES